MRREGILNTKKKHTQKSGLPVIDMTKDGDNGRTGRELVSDLRRGRRVDVSIFDFSIWNATILRLKQNEKVRRKKERKNEGRRGRTTTRSTTSGRRNSSEELGGIPRLMRILTTSTARTPNFALRPLALENEHEGK